MMRRKSASILGSMASMAGRAGGAAAGAVARHGGGALRYGARHVASGTETLGPLMGMGMLGGAPASRKLVDGMRHVQGGADQIAGARQGYAPSEMNKASHQVILDEFVSNNDERLKQERMKIAALIDQSEVFMWKQALTGLELMAPVLAAPVVGMAADGIRGMYNQHQAKKTWNQLVRENKSLDTKKNWENFTVLRDFAPDIAKNPVTLRSELNRMQYMHGVPHEMIGNLASAQGSIRQQSFSDFGTRAGITGVSKVDIGKYEGSSDRLRAEKERAAGHGQAPPMSAAPMQREKKASQELGNLLSLFG